MIRILVISLYFAQKYPISEATLRGSPRNDLTPCWTRYRSSCFSMTEIFWARRAVSGVPVEEPVACVREKRKGLLD